MLCLCVVVAAWVRYWYYEVIERWRLVLVSCFGLLLKEGAPSQMVFVLLVNIASAVLALKVRCGDVCVCVWGGGWAWGGGSLCEWT